MLKIHHFIITSEEGICYAHNDQIYVITIYILYSFKTNKEENILIFVTGEEEALKRLN